MAKRESVETCPFFNPGLINKCGVREVVADKLANMAADTPPKLVETLRSITRRNSPNLPSHAEISGLQDSNGNYLLRCRAGNSSNVARAQSKCSFAEIAREIQNL